MNPGINPLDFPVAGFMLYNAFISGSDDDVVKLYDLTALCDSSQALQNPFTVPVGMLLYRVARNMWTNFRHRKASVIRTLLENCLFLLDQEKHSQVRKVLAVNLICKADIECI